MRYEEAPQDLQKAIDSSDRLYESGDPEWFNLLADDVTVYSVSSSEPFRGRDAYRQHFEKMLVGDKRKVKVLARDVQVLGEKAIQAQTNQIRQGEITANIRQTVVWHNAGDGWRIEHIHTTLVGTPTGPVADSLDSVRVLNEQIATVAAVLGVAQ